MTFNRENLIVLDIIKEEKINKKVYLSGRLVMLNNAYQIFGMKLRYNLFISFRGCLPKFNFAFFETRNLFSKGESESQIFGESITRLQKNYCR